MRLRHYILGICLFIMVSLTAVFSWELKQILKSGFDRLNQQYADSVRSVVLSIVNAKTDYLRNFAALLERNYDLSGMYVLSTETKDHRLVEEQLAAIQKKGRFDFVDILTPDGKALVRSELSLSRELLDKVLKKGKGVTALETKTDLALISLAPMNLYDETVGYVILGYYLNRVIAKDLASMTKAKVEFDLPDSDAGPNGSTPENTFPIFGLRGQPINVKVTAQSAFLLEMAKAIRENIFVFSTVCFFALVGFLYLLLYFGFTRRFARLLAHIEYSANRLEAGELPSPTSEKHAIKEMKLLSKAFNKFTESIATYDVTIREKSKQAAEAQKQAALSELAQDVAHNIRSPLSALDMFILAQKGVPEESRVFIRGAIRRIHDVANHLLERGREAQHSAQGEVETFPLVGLVDSIVSEKRIQYQDRKQIEFSFSPKLAPYGVFVRVQEGEFKTVLSNLLNNAVEALPEDCGKISLRIEIASSSDLKLLISDTGCGIPEEVLSQLGKRRATFGKAKGSGLGLAHAREKILSWGGQWNVTSELGKGTCVEITLPQAAPPAWFIPLIALPPEGTVVVLDDDVAIHRVWAERFDAVEAQSRGIHLVHFFMADELRSWCAGGGTSKLILCDYELGADEPTGLDLIRELGIGRNTVLVTGRYEDRIVRETCEELEVKLLPKPLAPYIPLEVAGAENRGPLSS